MAKAKDEKPSEESKNLPVSIEDQIKKDLAAQQGQLGALPSNKISLNEKQFTLPDGQKSPGPMEVIVLDFIWFMVHYPGVYNSNNPQQPNCFAIGRDKPDSRLLKPYEGVAEPQGETCSEKDCPKNEWKSSPTSGGKACKNQRRLIVVPPDFDEETEVMTMYVSPGGLKNFDAYVSRLKNEHGIMPIQAVTKVQFDANQSYPLLQFSFVGKHDNLNLAWGLKERSQDILLRPMETEKDKNAEAA